MFRDSVFQELVGLDIEEKLGFDDKKLGFNK